MPGSPVTNTIWRLPFVYVYERSDFSVSFYAFQIYPETIKRALFYPVKDISKLTDELVAKTGPATKICILPEGPQTIPYLRKKL